jgi:hypothetical protein
MVRTPSGARQPTPIFARFGGDPELAAFIQLVNRLRGVPGVAKIRFATGGDRVHLWVLTATEDLEANKQIFRLEQDFRAAQEMSPIALRVIPLSEVAEDDLPPAEQLYPETA